MDTAFSGRIAGFALLGGLGIRGGIRGQHESGVLVGRDAFKLVGFRAPLDVPYFSCEYHGIFVLSITLKPPCAGGLDDCVPEVGEALIDLGGIIPALHHCVKYCLLSPVHECAAH